MLKCALITIAVSKNITIKKPFLASSGKLFSEPEFLLGKSGKILYSQAPTPTAKIPMSPNVTRQPKLSPKILPSGKPSIIAIDVPSAKSPRACELLLIGATLTASEAVIDQNMACEMAISTRAMTKTVKFQATAQSA